MCSYYRKHIKEFAKIAHPLTELIKMGKNEIIWLNQHEETFNKLINCLTSKSLLLHFDDDKHVYLTILSFWCPIFSRILMGTQIYSIL